jgi:ribose transport system substrate-binding protein
MKHYFKALCIVVLVLSMASTVYAKSAKTKDIVIGFSNASVSNSWRAFMVANFRAEVAAHPEIKKVYETDANDKPFKQIADIEDLMLKGVDVLIVSPATQEGINPVLEEAYDEGIPIILVDRKVSTDDYTCFLESSSYEMGKGQAEWLVKELGGKGNIVLLSGVAGSGPAEDRLRGAREVFKKHPGIKELAHQYTDWDLAKSKAAMEAFIQEFPKIDGVWADSGLMSWPALEALKAAGRPLVPSTGDQLNGYAKFLVKNDVRGFIYPYPAWISAEAVKMALKVVKGKEVPKYYEVPVKGFGPEEIKKLVQMEKSDFWWVGDDQIPEEFLPDI